MCLFLRGLCLWRPPLFCRLMCISSVGTHWLIKMLQFWLFSVCNSCGRFKHATIIWIFLIYASDKFLIKITPKECRCLQSAVRPRLHVVGSWARRLLQYVSISMFKWRFLFHFKCINTHHWGPWVTSMDFLPRICFANTGFVACVFESFYRGAVSLFSWSTVALDSKSGWASWATSSNVSCFLVN